jgi:hypothetical protein
LKSHILNIVGANFAAKDLALGFDDSAQIEPAQKARCATLQDGCMPFLRPELLQERGELLLRSQLR